MSELNTLIMVLKMCGILGMQGDLQPSDAFNCRQQRSLLSNIILMVTIKCIKIIWLMNYREIGVNNEF